MAKTEVTCPICSRSCEIEVTRFEGEHSCEWCSATFEMSSTGKSMISLRDPSLSTAQRRSWQPGLEILDDFVVERHLGRGGMGDVYLVRRRSTNEPFALKRVLPEYVRDESHHQRLLVELRTWQDLPGHPNLAACRFFRTVAGLPTIFAEYVEGGSLSEWIRGGKLYGGSSQGALGQILDVAIQVAWGLETVHRRGLIHQDVKPANVLMTLDGTAKVTDFGLAKARARVETAMPPRVVADWAKESDTVHLASLVSWGGHD